MNAEKKRSKSFWGKLFRHRRHHEHPQHTKELVPHRRLGDQLQHSQELLPHRQYDDQQRAPLTEAEIRGFQAPQHPHSYQQQRPAIPGGPNSGASSHPPQLLHGHQDEQQRPAIPEGHSGGSDVSQHQEFEEIEYNNRLANYDAYNSYHSIDPSGNLIDGMQARWMNYYHGQSYSYELPGSKRVDDSYRDWK